MKNSLRKKILIGTTALWFGGLGAYSSYAPVYKADYGNISTSLVEKVHQLSDSANFYQDKIAQEVSTNKSLPQEKKYSVQRGEGFARLNNSINKYRSFETKLADIPESEEILKIDADNKHKNKLIDNVANFLAVTTLFALYAFSGVMRK